MSALNAVTAAYHVSHWPGWVCAYTREEGALAVALAPPGVPRPVDVPVIFLRGPNREQIRYSPGPVGQTRGSGLPGRVESAFAGRRATVTCRCVNTGQFLLPKFRLCAAG